MFYTTSSISNHIAVLNEKLKGKEILHFSNLKKLSGAEAQKDDSSGSQHHAQGHFPAHLLIITSVKCVMLVGLIQHVCDEALQ